MCETYWVKLKFVGGGPIGAANWNPTIIDSISFFLFFDRYKSRIIETKKNYTILYLLVFGFA